MNEKRYRVIIGILLVGLLLAVGGGYVAFRYANNYYRQLNGLALDPLSLDYYGRVPDEALGDETVVVFFGDSRAEQWVVPAEMPAFTFINRGIGAQTSAQILARFEAHITPIQPDIIVLQLCINDLKTIPLFPERKQRIIDNCQDNIAEIVAKSNAIGAQIIITTVMPAGKIPLARQLVWSEDVGLGVFAVNEFIQDLDGVVILDAWAIVEENERLHPNYSLDTLHLNEAGYQALNQELEQLLPEMK